MTERRKKPKRKRCILLIVIAALLLLVLLFWFSGLPLWRNRAYIESLEPIPHRTLKIETGDTGEYEIYMEENSDFKILQLTDIHLGSSFFTQGKDLKAMKAVYALADAVRPDLIVVTGDLVYPIPIQTMTNNNLNPALAFADLMAAIGIPWCFVYGNHDTESLSTNPGKELNYLFEYSNTCLFAPVETLHGRSNQLIRLRNADGTLNQALVLLDSNSYASASLNDYDYIHDDQVRWYEERIAELSIEEGHTVSSLLFFHIPLQEFRTAYELFRAGSPEVVYFYGAVGEKNGGIACSEYPSKLFDTAVRLQSTKAIFVGHDHLNTISLEYRGIRLTYGLSIDYLAYPGISRKTGQRGGTLITVHPDAEISIEPVYLRDIVS